MVPTPSFRTTSDRHADWHSEHGSAQATFPISLEQREKPRDCKCHYDTSIMFVCLPTQRVERVQMYPQRTRFFSRE